MEKVNSVKISILGKTYRITTDESQESIVEASRLVDGLLSEKTNGLSASSESVALIIVALELASELGKLKRIPRIWQDKVADLNEMIDVALQ